MRRGIIIYEYETKYPNVDDFQSSPKDSGLDEGITFYKCSDTDKLPNQYVEPMIEKSLGPPKNDEERLN
ncbi:hypothetical protein P1A28_14010 [Staphylococcus equorum]|uniref:hypothetical protein n=1 Tax=Staphylococcus equorum TaxID=246432 RepID=UPI002555F366|nr:hypothetical protein [Staphylococcus equorum]MDK9844795.1 hypothetical protein [Staphylococcus equorum]